MERLKAGLEEFKLELEKSSCPCCQGLALKIDKLLSLPIKIDDLELRSANQLLKAELEASQLALEKISSSTSIQQARAIAELSLQKGADPSDYHLAHNLESKVGELEKHTGNQETLLALIEEVVNDRHLPPPGFNGEKHSLDDILDWIARELQRRHN